MTYHYLATDGDPDSRPTLPSFCKRLTCGVGRTSEYSMPAVIATWPSRLNHPVTQLASGLCLPARRLLQKYRPPEVGYAAHEEAPKIRQRVTNHATA